MKKHIRFLSLALSLVLLLCSAFPASAEYLDGPLPVPDTVEMTLTGSYGTQYSVTATYLNFDSTRDARSTGISVHHSGLYDNCLEGTVYGDCYTWTASSNFPLEYRSHMWSAAAMCNLTYEVTNAEEYFCIEIPMDLPKADYSLNYGCWQYGITGTYIYSGGNNITTISSAPRSDGIFTYIEY